VGAAVLSAFVMSGVLTPAAAQPVDANATRYLAGTCANCHGTRGASRGAGPSLGGQTKAFLLEKLKGFRDGSKKATLMHQISKGFTEAQLEALADYYSRQPAAR
jgi:cytochrome c553